MRMFLSVLVALLGTTNSQIYQRQEAAVVGTPRGFYPVAPPAVPKNTTNTTADYFSLTNDGRLERVQLVFPQGVQVQAVPQPASAEFLLTPDGRLERLQEEPVENNEVVQYFKLTEDGRLQSIKQEDIPTDAKEESGEYHVLLPSGSLQRVRFMTTTKGNLLSAKVQYQEIEPISGPVYQYASPLVRVV